jgi:hypothetical protein
MLTYTSSFSREPSSCTFINLDIEGLQLGLDPKHISSGDIVNGSNSHSELRMRHKFSFLTRNSNPESGAEYDYQRLGGSSSSVTKSPMRKWKKLAPFAIAVVLFIMYLATNRRRNSTSGAGEESLATF